MCDSIPFTPLFFAGRKTRLVTQGEENGNFLRAVIRPGGPSRQGGIPDSDFLYTGIQEVVQGAFAEMESRVGRSVSYNLAA
jgi:hypothetical protein